MLKLWYSNRSKPKEYQ